MRVTGTGHAGMLIETAAGNGWKFDLPTGRCETSAGHPIRARRINEPPAAG
ncbi:DUF2950 domain-containing protein [Dactylosporangium sp. NBC_01737]|uniref:hypothetical protein n=1 Tax=Dactylosporangium sp. NBC_01737 TaxID=2975959 RepID=UPI002E126AE0|nr:DUF2950 domain-containing protein [Dactylosporangium sp. NBC_01737]